MAQKMKFLGIGRRTEESSDSRKFVTIAQEDIRNLVFKYIGQLETEVSEKWCKCLWAFHPDDQDLKPGACRECGGIRRAQPHDKESPYSRANPEHYHPFSGKRMRRVDDHPECPVHTREGMVMHFFEWVSSSAAPR